MPILGNTPRACFRQFVEHLNALVRATLPTKVPFEAAVGEDDENLATLQFRAPGAYTVELPSKYGKVHVAISQSLECTADKKRTANQRYQLRTRRYWYRIQAEPGSVDALVRWEYLSPMLADYADKHWCWRHVQMGQTISMPIGDLDLDKSHLPSGYIVIEDVIRFLIADLGVKPPCGANWHDKLTESERLFRRQFNAYAG